MNSELKHVADELNNDDANRVAEQTALAEAVAVPAHAAGGEDLVPQQTEMPFAIVEGEPYTEIPRDLYIPPDALQVFLEAFEGPLDLLLYLIRKQNLDILDIPIAEITRQYMGYIDVMQDLQLELAGEYLLMAAMLAEIKSRMLLPRPKTEDGQEEEDPRAELVRRLQEYERFKKAADDLDRLKRMERDVLPAVVELTEKRVTQRLPDVTLSEMLKAFREVVQRSEHFSHHHIHREPLSQRQRMTEILTLVENAEFVEFIRLFNPEEGRMGVTVTFISILELMKEGLIDIVQAEPYAPLHVRKANRRTVSAELLSDESADADAANAAALAQPELPDENVVDDEAEDENTTEAQEESMPETSVELSVEVVAEVIVSDGDPESGTDPELDAVTNDVEQKS
jgi:segregation and condensation protein A